MSDVITKPRPMIDLDEFERRLRPLGPGRQNDGDTLLAELSQIIGHKDGAHVTDFQPPAGPLKDEKQRGEKAQTSGLGGSCKAGFAVREDAVQGKQQPEAGSPGAMKPAAASKPPMRPAPFISGDFAAIEAGLLSALREQTAKPPSDPDISKDLLLSAEPKHPGESPPPARSPKGRRRWLYAAAALITAGMAGLAVNFVFSNSSETISIRSDNEESKQADATSSADVPAQAGASLNQPPEPSPMALASGTGPGSSSSVPQAEAAAPPAGAPSPIGNEAAALPAAPSAPAQEPAAAEPPQSAAAPDMADTAKTDATSQNAAAPLAGGSPPSHAEANAAATPAAAPQPPAAAKPPAAKAAAHKVTPQKSAAKHPGAHNPARQLANQTKVPSAIPATPAAPANADARAEAAIPSGQSSPAANSPMGLIQGAVNSLTSTTAKLFNWSQN